MGIFRFADLPIGLAIFATRIGTESIIARGGSGRAEYRRRDQAVYISRYPRIGYVAVTLADTTADPRAI